MPTQPDWELGLASELTDWYILPCRDLPAELQRQLASQVQYAHERHAEYEWFLDEVARMQQYIDFTQQSVAEAVVPVSLLNELRENLNSMRARLAWLQKRNWASRYHSLKAQLDNNLNKPQQEHNTLRNCENSCLTCSYNRDAEECRSLFGRGRREKIGEFRQSLGIKAGTECGNPAYEGRKK